MAYPRRPSLAVSETPQRNRIDARSAVHRDMGGNVISEPGEMAYSGMHRDMGGAPMSGTSILTGATSSFPTRRGTTPAAPAAATPAATGNNFPRSRMSTGNPAVAFASPEQQYSDRAYHNTPEQARNAAMPGYANAGPMTRRMLLRNQGAGKPVSDTFLDQASGAPGAMVLGRGTAAPKLTSVFGTASASRAGAAPAVTPAVSRIADESGDRTKQFAAGGVFSSVAKPKPAAAPQPTVVTNGTPAPVPMPSPFPKRKPVAQL